ncbi:hypothetical protein PZ61_0235865 [Streptomyces sp. MNU77]|uniref:VOC family protein n=1 Tax=Streptomyces sp. MNU77 TaxID=1573406 RepID=UPI00063FEE89|nr:VOC family protein [Streptomyces sp. MNU77]OLO25813.1 hypothetical protein PZ61_0235865 [Streptomyces sp. MNU77]
MATTRVQPARTVVVPAPAGVDQLGFVVPDIEAAMAYWSEVLGVGPFFYLPKSAIRSLTYQGRETDVASSTALAQCGGVQIELVQQRNDAPSAYADFLRDHPTGGLHHLGRFVSDYDAAVAESTAAGRQVIQEGSSSDRIRFCYVGGPGRPGMPLELIEVPALRVLFDHIADAARTWDGSAPVRSVDHTMLG